MKETRMKRKRVYKFIMRSPLVEGWTWGLRPLVFAAHLVSVVAVGSCWLEKTSLGTAGFLVGFSALLIVVGRVAGFRNNNAPVCNECIELMVPGYRGWKCLNDDSGESPSS